MTITGYRFTEAYRDSDPFLVKTNSLNCIQYWYKMKGTSLKTHTATPYYLHCTGVTQLQSQGPKRRLKAIFALPLPLRFLAYRVTLR